MSDFGHSLEEEIQRAIQSGAFDDLPGKGKPLNLEVPFNQFKRKIIRLHQEIAKITGQAD